MRNPRLYLAGKMGVDGDHDWNWRKFIIDLNSILIKTHEEDGWVDQYPVIEDAIAFDSGLVLDYAGPYFISNLKGHISHNDYTRGVSHGIAEESFRHRSISSFVNECSKKAITSADIICAWVGSNDAYGTLFEIGYACALGKEVWMYYPKDLSAEPAYLGGTSLYDDLWFIKSSVTRSTPIEYDSALGGTPDYECVPKMFKHFKFEYRPPGFIDVPQGNQCYLYIISSSLGIYKIGISDNPKKRLKQLQTGNHEKCRLIMSVPFDNASGAREAEYKLHQILGQYKSNGEWFKIPPTVISATIFNVMESIG